ncbi:Hfi1p TDEL_0A07040 [Torulaspora delbrueckii]|uniref:Transcriptional coactivator HFI1/ADA1 n=1 Tax=Torulaspora delbrueckii TaxID=4950 RepID=G8ZN42_TORDE|nr:hypothetical protein TDEL_0A07040 [Torulaspora delbrueckii]CCE90036.1 hypothetical protein TDEL_0A07040 [Torulaspora delbrueckii]
MSLNRLQANGATPGQLGMSVQSPGAENRSGASLKAPNAAMTPSEAMTPAENDSNLRDVSNQRIELESMIGELTSILGKDQWTKYAQVISLFILGKLSRKELSNELDLLFTPSATNTTEYSRSSLIRLHNQLLLGIFINSLKDSPLMGNLADGTWGFGHGSSLGNKMKRANKHNSQIENYKKIVMSLPADDRQRLKEITKEAGKRGFVLSSVLQARLNIIPKIPIVINPETLKRVKANNLKTPLEWSQDIMNGFNAPLATDTYSLPDTESLFLRMVGIAREHGLVGAVDTGCAELLSLALDHYLKNIVESAIDTVRYRRKKYSEYYDIKDSGMYEPVVEARGDECEAESHLSTKVVSLTNEDLYECLNLFPNLVEPTGAYFSLPMVNLANDDELVVSRSSIDDMPDFSDGKPTFTPLDERNIGTREELNWLIKDILTEE